MERERLGPLPKDLAGVMIPDLRTEYGWFTSRMPKSARRLLDLAASSGKRAYAFANQFPELEVDALDIKDNERLHKWPGINKIMIMDARDLDVREHYDVVWMNMFSAGDLTKAMIQKLTDVVWNALRDNGIWGGSFILRSEINDQAKVNPAADDMVWRQEVINILNSKGFSIDLFELVLRDKFTDHYNVVARK